MMTDPIDAEPSADTTASKRRRPRDSMLLMGSIKAFGDVARMKQQIRIRNLSATGLMADSEAAFDLGCLVEVELRGVGAVSGEVVWIRQNRMGITFSAPIDPKLARKPVSQGENFEILQIQGQLRRPGLRIA
jgi:hypothetical protein